MNDVSSLAGMRIACGPARTQYAGEFDPELGALWGWMQPKGNPCFSLSLLNDIQALDERLRQDEGCIEADGKRWAVNYYVFGSRTKAVFNFGGDLALFLILIKAREREALTHYARRCLDCLYPKIRNFDSPTLTTISLVQGDALGGGFEAALSSDVIVAEESAVMGFPEILFNLFPGMGGYSLLARHAGRRLAEDLIASGRMVSARELKELGIVDVVAPDGEGERAAHEWIKRNHKRRNGLLAMYAARQRVFPLERRELDGIAEIWVDAALRLGERDLKMMRRIVSAQLRRMDGALERLPTAKDLDQEQDQQQATQPA